MTNTSQSEDGGYRSLPYGDGSIVRPDPHGVGLNPDEECAVCSTKRDEHGDKHHKFSTDGTLLPIQEGPKARQTPPAHREDVPKGRSPGDPTARALATLVEILAEKTISFDGVNRPILDTKDIVRIFLGEG